LKKASFSASISSGVMSLIDPALMFPPFPAFLRRIVMSSTTLRARQAVEHAERTPVCSLAGVVHGVPAATIRELC
jgi:hypothetical protein